MGPAFHFTKSWPILPTNTLLDSKSFIRWVCSNSPHQVLLQDAPILCFHRVAMLSTEPCSEMSASFVAFLPIRGISQKREPNATHRPWATFLQCIPGAPHSDEVFQMIDVGSSWVATTCRPPQLAFVLSRVVCVLLGCSWAVAPTHLLFRACPQTQMATATKKIPRLREAIEFEKTMSHTYALLHFAA